MRRSVWVTVLAMLLSLLLTQVVRGAGVAQTWSIGPEPFGVTVDASTGKVYVASSRLGTLMAIVDPAVPPPPPEPFPTPDRWITFPASQTMSVIDPALGRMFVTLANNAVAIVDLSTNTMVASVPDAGSIGIALDPASHRVYAQTPGAITLIDGTNGAVLVRTVATNGFWWGISHDPTRHRVYVANADNYHPSLVVLNDSDLSLIRDVPLRAVPRFTLSVDTAHDLIYVGGLAAIYPTAIDPAGRLYAIDAATLETTASIDVGGGAGGVFSTTLDPATNSLYVSTIDGYPSSTRGDAIVVVDTATFAVTQRIPLAFQPGQSALHPDGHLYVAAFSTSQLAAVCLTNCAPVIDSLSLGSPSTATVVSPYTSFRDPDGDAVTATYRWSLNGAVITDVSGPTLDLGAPGHGDRGDVISLVLTISDGTFSTTRSASAVIENALPAISLKLSSVTPRTNDTLTATASASDADGDAVTLAYSWSRNGTLIAGATGTSLDLTQYGDRGDVIAVNVSADDGHGGVSTRTERATVADSAPVVTLTTSTTAPKTNDTIFATATMTDAEGDARCCGWYLKRNGAVVWYVSGGTTMAFDLNRPGWGDRGDTVTIEAVAGDGTLETRAVVSAVVVNSPPVGGVALSNYSPTKKDDLVAYGSVFDADGDVVPFTYTWQVGQKVKLVVGPTSASSSRFDLRELQPGDVVTVTVTPASDGFDPGVPSSATAVVRSPK